MSKFLKITAVLMLCVTVLSLGACKSDKPIDTDATTSVTTSAETTAPKTTVPETTAAPVGVNLYAAYKPVRAYDENGDEVELYWAFGTGYRDYGGILELNEDKTFLISIGVNKGDGVGEYSLTAEDEITLNYTNGKTDTIKITKVEDNIATELLVHYNGFDVVFC